VAQSTSDRDVTLRREQIMQARRLWENTASEETLGELFAPYVNSNDHGQMDGHVMFKLFYTI